MGTQVLVLNYGYVESLLPGYDIWASAEEDFPTEWAALRSLASYLLRFYLGEQEGLDQLRSKSKCCEECEDLRCLPGAALPKFCPVCGRRYSRGEFNVEHFVYWIKEIYTRENHELPNFWEYDEDWCNTHEMGYLLESYPAPSFFEVREKAEEVLACALDPEEVPENSRTDFKELVKFWFARLDENVQQAYFDFEEHEGREPEMKTAWEEE